MHRATCTVKLRRHPQRLLLPLRAPTRTVRPPNAITRWAEEATAPMSSLRSTRTVRLLPPARQSTALPLRRRTRSTRAYHHHRCLNPRVHGVHASLHRPPRSRWWRRPCRRSTLTTMKRLPCMMLRPPSRRGNGARSTNFLPLLSVSRRFHISFTFCISCATYPWTLILLGFVYCEHDTTRPHPRLHHRPPSICRNYSPDLRHSF